MAHSKANFGGILIALNVCIRKKVEKMTTNYSLIIR